MGVNTRPGDRARREKSFARCRALSNHCGSLEGVSLGDPDLFSSQMFSPHWFVACVLGCLGWGCGEDLAGPYAPGSEEVTLQIAEGTLFGTVQLPDGATDGMPLVLFHAGSGPTDRDGNSALGTADNDSLALLATELGQAGFASLR